MCNKLIISRLLRLIILNLLESSRLSLADPGHVAGRESWDWSDVLN